MFWGGGAWPFPGNHLTSAIFKSRLLLESQGQGNSSCGKVHTKLMAKYGVCPQRWITHVKKALASGEGAQTVNRKWWHRTYTRSKRFQRGVRVEAQKPFRKYTWGWFGKGVFVHGKSLSWKEFFHPRGGRIPSREADMARWEIFQVGTTWGG